MLNYSLRVHSLLTPIEGSALLLPNASIAEVTQFSQPEPMKGTPDWLMGFVKWRELKIPLILYEVILGNDVPSTKGTKWILVLNALGGKVDMPFFSILVQEKPGLVQADESIVTPMAKTPANGVLSYVHVHGQPAIIPDPDYLETMLRQIMKKAG